MSSCSDAAKGKRRHVAHTADADGSVKRKRRPLANLAHVEEREKKRRRAHALATAKKVISKLTPISLSFFAALSLDATKLAPKAVLAHAMKTMQRVKAMLSDAQAVLSSPTPCDLSFNMADASQVYAESTAEERNLRDLASALTKF